MTEYEFAFHEVSEPEPDEQQPDEMESSDAH